MSGKKEISKAVEKLKKEINYHNWLYYVKNSPEISDGEYDKLYGELAELERKHPEFRTSDSPTQRVGGEPLREFRPVKHGSPMLSLENTYSADDIRQWITRNQKLLAGRSASFVVEPKIDGVGISLRYEKGKFVLGSTRGDGSLGDDITSNIRTIKSIPLALRGNFPEILEVRGEVYMGKDSFEALNRERSRGKQSLFANPRNAAAGTLKLLDPAACARRKMNCFIYQAGEISPESKIKTHREMLDFFGELGLRVNPRIKKFTVVDEIIGYFDDFAKTKDSLNYEVDGMVIKINEIPLYKILGTTLKSPRWACAYKFPAKQGSARILSVDVQVGRTGVLTPVANLSPAKIGGVVIKRATLHNFDEVNRLGVKVGDYVWVERCGDVIPKITGVITSKRTGGEKEISVPEVCPVCGADVFAGDENVAVVCTNSFCPAQVERGIVHFASRGAMDIEGLGEKIIHLLLERGLVKKVSDIYLLEKEKLLKLPLVKDKKAENILNGILSSKRRPLSRFLFGMGIPHVGDAACRLLALNFRSIENIRKADARVFEEIEGLGPKMALAIKRFFSLSTTKKILKELKAAGVKYLAPEEPDTKKLSGKIFVFTGTIPMPREKAREMILSNDGKVSSSVSERTDFVVAGENPGSKLEKAKKLGVKIITFDEFLKLLEKKGDGSNT